jgi:predicted Kef-type K+ transport protein
LVIGGRGRAEVFALVQGAARFPKPCIRHRENDAKRRETVSSLVLGIIVIGKSLAAFAIVLALRQPLKTALIVSASLAQIGEFSFILAALGIELHLLPSEGQHLIVAGALLSITLNPLIFKVESLLIRKTEIRGDNPQKSTAETTPTGTEP